MPPLSIINQYTCIQDLDGRYQNARKMGVKLRRNPGFGKFQATIPRSRAILVVRNAGQLNLYLARWTVARDPLHLCGHMEVWKGNVGPSLVPFLRRGPDEQSVSRTGGPQEETEEIGVCLYPRRHRVQNTSRYSRRSGQSIVAFVKSQPFFCSTSPHHARSLGLTLPCNRFPLNRLTA
jgi:hypothetical protein